MALNFPPLDRSLLFPDLINFHMERNPSFPAFVYPSESVLDTATEISFLEFGRAAHRVAHALRPSRQGPDGEVVMVIANTDTILHHAVVVGLSVAGWVPFPVSPRNSAAAVVNMMSKTNCTRIVTLDHAHKCLINVIRKDIACAQLTIYELPTLRYTFPRLGHEVAIDPFVPYPPIPERPDLDSPALYLHSSGSTGFPKPIAHTHRLQTEWLTRGYVRQCAEVPSPRRMAAMSLPPFHTFGFAIGVYGPIAALVTTVVYPPRTENDPLAQPVIPTSNNMIEVLKKIRCNIVAMVPTFLEQMAMSEEAIEILKKIDSVTFGGGPLPARVGDKLWAAGVQLASNYGGTEFGAPLALTDKRDIADGDWMWMRLIDDWKVRWVPQGDGTYELQLMKCEKHQLAVLNIPDVEGYATSDVFVKHPTKDAWKIIGRVDDVIMLASGEKTVPVPMEGLIGSSPLVQGVLMFGRARNQVGVLVEPRAGHAIDVNDEKAVTEFRDQIWPVIEEANEISPSFSRIFKEMILVTSVDKPMLRAPKGTVQRKATLSAYETDINALYDTVETRSVLSDSSAAPSAWTSEAVGEWLLDYARAINAKREIDPQVDFFAQGFDSLSATFIRNRILGAMQNSSDPEINKAAARLPLNVIFEYPTISRLSSRISALVGNNGMEQVVDFTEQHKQVINAMIEKYSAGLDGPADGVLPTSRPIMPAVVLLTGSTGGLGSVLLSQLLQSPTVQRVFAFNRPCSRKSIEERQRSAFKDRGLAIDLLYSSKLEYVEADASLDNCGLSLAQYEEIRNSITLVIHNAWRLDFNLSITSFEDSIQASRNLVDLCLTSPRKEHLRFLFTSSIASAQGWNNANGLFPEEIQLDPAVAVGAGYGESKYATERIIVQSGLHTTSFRIGQIAGGHGGSWATTDWFPIIVKSSIALGVLPESTGVVSWLRVEDVASTILETAFAKEAPPPALNIVNPRSVPWADIITFVRRAIIKRRAPPPTHNSFSLHGALWAYIIVFVRRMIIKWKGGNADRSNLLRIVSFGDWFTMLEKKAEDASEGDLVKIPAIKLLEFLRCLARGDKAIRKLASSVAVLHGTDAVTATTATEAAGTANFSTAKAQRVSPTMANMQAIGKAEADAWVRYWISKGAF